MATTYTLIDKTTLGSSAASVSFTSIPSTYTDLNILVSARGDTAQMTFNGSSSGYKFVRLMGTGSSVSSGANGSATSFEGFEWNYTTYTANTFSSTSIYIPNYAGSNYKSISLDVVQENNATQAYAQMYAGLWSNTAAITSITLTSSGNQFVSGSSFYLYGIKNS